MLETGVDHRARDHQRDARAGHLVGRLAAELAHRLDLQLEAVHVALGEVAAAGVERQRARPGAMRFSSVRNSLASSAAKKPCSTRLISTPPVKFS